MTDSNFTKTFTTDNFTQFINNTNTIGKEVGGLARLTTTVDSDLVGAINELDSDIGARPHTNLNTNTKNLTAAINEIHTAGNASLVGLTPDSANKLGGFNDSAERNTVGGALNSLSADVRTLDSDIGSARAKTTLTTTSKNIVGSINELDAEIGDSALDSGLTGMTIRRAINALDSNHDSATTQLRTDIANSFRYTTITGDTGSDTVDSANGSLAIVGDGIIQTTMSGNRLLVDHTVIGATDVNNSGKTYVQDITMDSAGHVTAIGSTAISGLDNNDIAAGAAINAEKIHDGTVSNTEFGYLNGVTSGIQSQIDTKQATIDTSNRLDASLIHDGTISNTEFGHLNGVDSNIQAQLDSISNVSLNPATTPLFPLGRGILNGVLPTNSTVYNFGEVRDDSGYPRFSFNISPAVSGNARQTRIYGGGKVNNYNLSNDTQPAIQLQPTSGDDTNVRSNLEQGPPFQLFYNGRVKGGFGTSRNDPYVYSYQSYDAYCIRSRVNYNGVSNTTSVNADGVSSVTDYGTGNFRVNFASEASAAHANMGSGSSAYSWAGAAKGSSTVHPGVSVAQHPSYTMFNSYLHIAVGTGGGANSQGFFFDLDEVCIMTSA